MCGMVNERRLRHVMYDLPELTLNTCYYSLFEENLFRVIKRCHVFDTFVN